MNPVARHPVFARRRFFTACSACLLALVLVSAGCDTVDGGWGSQSYCGASETSYDDHRALFAAYCRAMDRCAIGVEMGYSFRCLGECVQTLDFSLTCGIADDEDDFDRFERSLLEREVVYDDAQGAECIAWWDSASCDTIERLFSAGAVFNSDSDSDSDESNLFPDACQDVLEITDDESYSPPGTAAEGERCDYDGACDEGLHCPQEQPSDETVYCRVCEPYPGPGEPCMDYSCAIGSYCDSAVDPAMCTAALAVGDECSASHHCTSTSCYEGVCFDRLPDGQPCADWQQCDSDYCYQDACFTRLEEADACDDDAACLSNRCYLNACIEVSEVGDPCDDHAQCWSSCYRGECIGDRQTDEPCDDDENCRWDSVCYDGACVEADEMPVGAPCESDYDCFSNLCIENLCVEWKENGDLCDVPEECTSQICFENACGYPDGEECNARRECRSDRCPNDTVCITPLPDGQPCTFAEECLSWTCLESECFTYRLAGESCESTTQCSGSMFCESESGLCELPRANGEPCVSDEHCNRGYCDPVAELCGHSDGEECQYSSECQGYCDPTLGQCVPRKDDGADCTQDEECLGYCVYSTCRPLRPYGQECVYGYECEGGRCLRDSSRYRCAGPGECFQSDHCEPTEYCIEDDWPYLCGPPKADGEDCESDDECVNYCHSVCVALRLFGDPCVDDEECIDGLCDDESCSMPGLCDWDEDCPEGQFCDRDLYRPLCVDPKADGSSCDDDEECVSGWCSFQSDTCKTRPGLGDACMSWECTPDAYCWEGVCVRRKMPGEVCNDGFYDDAECLGPAICRNGRCEAMPLECTPGQAGQMCTFLMVCAEDAYCDLLDNFTCKRRSQIGEECENTMWGANTCVHGSQCDSGVCEAYAGLSESCAERACDPREGYCNSDSNTCRPRKYGGELCMNDSECLSGDCDYQGDDVYRCRGACRMPE